MKHKNLDSLKVFELRKTGMSINELARKFKVAPTTIYYHLNKIDRLADDLSFEAQKRMDDNGK